MPSLDGNLTIPSQEQGYPWIVRKTIVKFGSAAATDIIWQSGATLKVVSVNAKGAWQRKMIIGKEVHPASDIEIGKIELILDQGTGKRGTPRADGGLCRDGVSGFEARRRLLNPL